MAHAPSDREFDPTRPQKTRPYNPYQDLNIPIHNLYQLPTSPEFLFSEESLRQRRSWGENLTFYTGTAYLGASAAGATAGLFSALKSFEPTDTLKLKVNRILNSSGHSGRLWGNRIGVVGLIYAMMESGFVAVTDRDDVWSSVAAGLGTGAVCRAARGLRSAAVAGALGGLAAGVVVAGKQALKRADFLGHLSKHGGPPRKKLREILQLSCVGCHKHLLRPQHLSGALQCTHLHLISNITSSSSSSSSACCSSFMSPLLPPSASSPSSLNSSSSPLS